MASINGISLKEITEFLGHEQEPLCQGDLYLNEKKIGFWSQDSWGGPDRLHLDREYSEKLLNDAITARNPDKAIHSQVNGNEFVIEYDLDDLLFEYLDLKEDERLYEAAVKTGYDGILVATDGYHHSSWNLPKSYTALTNEELLAKLKSSLELVKKSFLPENETTKHSVRIYRTPADFEIGDPIKFEEIIPRKDLNKIISDAKGEIDQVRKDVSNTSHKDRGADQSR